MEERLTKREEFILRTLIETHIAKAEPVSSRTLSKRPDITLSPASIRNTLADLEEKEMLAKPHTSAGRIPTDLGYQYYADNLMRPVELTDSERGAFSSIVTSADTDMVEVLESMARVLAHLTRQLGVIIAPLGEELCLHHLDVIPIADCKVSLVVTTTSGLVRSVILELPRAIDYRRLAAACSLINERLGGLNLEEIRATIRRRLADIIALRDVFLSYVINSADHIFRFDIEESMHYFGTSQLLEQPEFRNIERLKSLVEMLENPTSLIHILSVAPTASGVNIRISQVMDGIAIVNSSYETTRGIGTVSIMGPPRMDYARAVSILSYTCHSLSGIFAR